MVAIPISEWLDGFARLFRADAVLIAAWNPRKEHCTSLGSFGYSPGSVLALVNEYPHSYSVQVLTEIYGGIDPLVYTIGAQPPSRKPFRQSRIYREALALQGFQDGLTIQLRHGETHVGYAHFSSKQPDVYDDHLQRYGRVLNGVLSEPIMRSLSLTGQGWLLVYETGVVDLHQGDLPLRADDSQLLKVAVAFLRWSSAQLIAFTWVDGRRFTRVTLERQQIPTAVRVTAKLIPAPFGLTATELRVLTGMVVYASNEAIAAALGTSVRTVQSHVTSVLRKLDCTSRTQAVVLALRHRLLLPDSDSIVAFAGWALSQ